LTASATISRNSRCRQNTLFYVAGSFARKISVGIECECCTNLFIATNLEAHFNCLTEVESDTKRL
jgi:hypothetical protein